MNTLITVSRLRTIIATALCGAAALSFAVTPAVGKLYNSKTGKDVATRLASR